MLNNQILKNHQAFISGINRFFSTTSSNIKPQRKPLPKLDPKKDFKYFIARAKVCSVYREALQLAKQFPPDSQNDMTELMRYEFDVFRRQKDQPLDTEKIDYYLALIRKRINDIKELKERVQ